MGNDTSFRLRPPVGASSSFSRLFSSLLLCSLLLSAGCIPANLSPGVDYEAQLQELESQRQALSQEQKALQTSRGELEVMLAKLDRKKSDLETARKNLDQELKKLEALKGTLKKRPGLNAASRQLDATAANGTKQQVLGEIETAYLDPPGISLSARIDTGARRSSVNALNMTEFERDGKPYVTFSITDPKTNELIAITRRVVSKVRIKEQVGESELRPVVKIRVTIGNIRQRIEFSLANRSDFKHQVLIGRNFLRDYAIVDVGKKYVSEPVTGKAPPK